MTKFAVDLNRSCVFANDVVTEGQTHAHGDSTILAGKVRLKDLVQALCRNTTSVVEKENDHVAFVGSGADTDFSRTLVKSLAGVDQQAHVDLVELLGVAIQRRQFTVGAYDRDIGSETWLHKRQGRIQTFVHIDTFVLRTIQICERFETVDDFTEPFDG